jgi:hypothetical protein
MSDFRYFHACAQFILIGTDVLLASPADLNHVSFVFIEQDTEDASQFHHWIVNSVTWIRRIGNLTRFFWYGIIFARRKA